MIFEYIGRIIIPQQIAGLGAIAYAYPRFYSKIIKAAFIKQNQNNSQLIFIAGLPKSGTTWLEKMMAEYTNGIPITPPSSVRFGHLNRGSNNYVLKERFFLHYGKLPVIYKTHSQGGLGNKELINKLGINHLIIHRDLRDVAVSHFYYVRNTPWHPEFKTYIKFNDIKEGLEYFAKNLLKLYRDWLDSWILNNKRGYVIKYEELKLITKSIMINSINHLRLELDEQKLDLIIDQNTFSNLKEKHNKQGKTFFRKGASGDWKNYFTDELKEIYKEIIGEYLIKNGYEHDTSW